MTPPSLTITGPNIEGRYTVRLYAYDGTRHFMKWTRVPVREFEHHGFLRALARVYRSAVAKPRSR